MGGSNRVGGEGELPFPLLCTGRGAGPAYFTFIESQWPVESAPFHSDYPQALWPPGRPAAGQRVIGRLQPGLGSLLKTSVRACGFIHLKRTVFGRGYGLCTLMQSLWFMHHLCRGYGLWFKLSISAAPSQSPQVSWAIPAISS